MLYFLKFLNSFLFPQPIENKNIQSKNRLIQYKFKSNTVLKNISKPASSAVYKPAKNSAIGIANQSLLVEYRRYVLNTKNKEKTKPFTEIPEI